MTEHTLLPGFPHLRHAPRHVTRGLRAVDPTTELVYVGWGRWLLVSVRPHREHIVSGEKILANARRLLALWEANPKLKANPGAFRRLINRHDFGLLTVLGARPIAEYKVQGEPTSAIVDDLRRMDYLFRTTSDQDVDTAVNAEQDKARADAHADLTDPGRSREGWRYAFVRSHGAASQAPQTQRVRSGFQRVTPTPVLQ